jgi:outer membrane receptor protein involved in Fe transport
MVVRAALAALAVWCMDPSTATCAPAPLGERASQAAASAPAERAAQQTPPAGQPAPPPPQPPKEPTPPAEIPTYEETVVVTASKTEQALLDAPATMTVISSQTLQNLPAQNYADVLRAVPGLNVTQLSARDINLTSRGATSVLATSQLALLDGRTIYLDFFGMVMWDLLPVNLNEIKQIEVIRGPASAVWGANALTGVVNIITKSPRELEGTSVTVGLGGFDRSVEGRDQSAGGIFYLNGYHAQAVNARWAYKISAGAYIQDAPPRPVGVIPNAFRTPYPSFVNQGTTQPKFDVRVDYDFPDGRQKLVLAGGLGATEGIIHTGIGPFDINRGSLLGYARMHYSRGGFKLNAFTNLLDGEADALLSRGPTGAPIRFVFDTQTYDIEVGNVQALGSRHALSYGGNVRHNQFNLSIAPLGDNRDEVGVYLQDEMLLSERIRWVVGGRLDKFDVLDNPVFSPRTTLLVKPATSQTIRVSYNRAYRAPSLVNNFLETSILNQIDLGLLNPALAGRVYVFPVRAVGYRQLDEESLDAYEVGYSGLFAANRVALSAAVYFTRTHDNILFTQVGSYSAAQPPPGWPLPLATLEAIRASGRFGPGNGLPSLFSYRNLGRVDNHGIEVGVEATPHAAVSVFANYAWQAEPEAKGFDLSELNLPPRHRANAGFTVSHGRYLGTFSVSYQSEAEWRDVLDSRFHGPTRAYTLVNGSFGLRWARDRLVTVVKVNNLTNEAIQQHVFGDVLKRQLVGELRAVF